MLLRILSTDIIVDSGGKYKPPETGFPGVILVNIDRLLGLIGGAGAGFTVGLDFACQRQGAFGQCRTYQFVNQHAEENDVADLVAVGEGGGGHGHAQGYTGLGQQGDAQVFGDGCGASAVFAAAICTKVFACATGNDVDYAQQQGDGIDQYI